MVKNKEGLKVILDGLRKVGKWTVEIEEIIVSHWKKKELEKVEKLVENLLKDRSKEEESTIQKKEKFNKKEKKKEELIMYEEKRINDSILLDILPSFEESSPEDFEYWIEQFEEAVDMAFSTHSMEKREAIKGLLLRKYLKKRALELYKDITHCNKYKMTFKEIIEYIKTNLRPPIDRFMVNKERLRSFVDMSSDFNKHFHEFVEKTVAITGVSKTILLGNVNNGKINEMNANDIKNIKALQIWGKTEYISTLPWQIIDHLEEWVESKSLLEIKNKAKQLIMKGRYRQEAFDKQIETQFLQYKEKLKNQENIERIQDCKPGNFCSSFETSIADVIAPIEFEQINNKKENKVPVRIDFREPMVSRVLRVKSSRNSFSYKKIELLILCIIMLSSSLVWGLSQIIDCNNGTEEIWKIQVPQMMSCKEQHQWHLELRNLYKIIDKNCEAELALLAVSPNNVLWLKEEPELLTKLSGNMIHCNKSGHALRKGYFAKLKEPLWTQEEISYEVYDTLPHFPKDMAKSIKGIATQLLLYKAGMMVVDLNDKQWEALFINVFQTKYNDLRRSSMFRSVIYSLIQKNIIPKFKKACERNQEEFNAIRRTMDPSEKARILLNRKDIRASLHEGFFWIQQCEHVHPQSIFTDYKYNNTCYTRMPIIVNGVLKFLDRDGYVFEYSIGHRCTQLSMEDLSEIEDKKKEAENKKSRWILEGNFFEILYNGKEILAWILEIIIGTISIILSFIIIYGLIKCIMKGRKWKNKIQKKHENKKECKEITSRVKEKIEMYQLANVRIQSVVSSIGKQPLIDLYIVKKESKEIMKCLFDSGAEISFIKKTSTKNIPDVKWFSSPIKVGEDFNGHAIFAMGNCITKFLLNSKVVPISLWIIEELHIDILLGSDALECLDKFNIPVTFRLNSNIIQIGDTQHPLISLARISMSSPISIWDSFKSMIWYVKRTLK
uniref:Peptidase A2 domain-containing protein n=1 Tax=Strongyloides stercoralis TaxID=6248 RepID=A0AAF5I338_STRER